MATNNAINFNQQIPAFLAYPNADILNQTGDGSVYDVIYNTKLFDTLTNYSTVTGKFTAPISGTYYFIGNIYGQHISGFTNFEVYLATTAATYMMLNLNANTVQYAVATACVWNTATSVHMTAGDTANLQFKVSGGAKTVDITQGGAASVIISFFGGYLVCPD